MNDAPRAAAAELRTARLRLVPATAASLNAAIEGASPLERVLGARVPGTWPPEFLDREALEYTRTRLEAGPEAAAWWMYFVLLRGASAPHGSAHRMNGTAATGEANDPGAVPSTLIGSAGYKGPPLSDGTVEIGYGIVSDQRRRGYASEVTECLVANAFAHTGVSRVIAETLPDLVGSIGVLARCGFRECGGASESFVIRFERPRPTT
ncbi:MAG TPA: GNAT family N-acetyltransferase [Gemmatimonadaceae bacterium]|nr:GNAT family N-acetyltransferase [Gemmatimonadaceae bacterium]